MREGLEEALQFRIVVVVEGGVAAAHDGAVFL